jgi:hypothetical protein
MTAEAIWADFGTQVAAAVTAGLVLTAVVAAVPALRTRVFGFLGRHFARARTLRLTSTLRQAAILTDAQAAADQAREEGRAEVRAAVEAERADVGMEPNWTVTFNEGANNFTLTDTHWAQNVSDVQLSAQHQEFRFDGSKTWLGPFNASTTFAGEVLFHGTRHGVTFTVTWRDRNRDSRSAKTFVDPDFHGK